MNEEYIKYEVESAEHKKQSYTFSGPTSLIEDQELSDKEKLLYIWMATYANKSRQCFASNNRLARELSCSISTISRGISNLKKQGWIDVELIYKPDSKEIKNRIVKFPHHKFNVKYKTKLPDPIYM